MKPDVESLEFGELRSEAFSYASRIEKCKQRLRDPRTVSEYVKAMEDLPILRSHMARVTGVYMKRITPNPNWR